MIAGGGGVGDGGVIGIGLWCSSQRSPLACIFVACRLKATLSSDWRCRDLYADVACPRS